MFAALALAATVTVSPGNTLSGIASHHGITWEQLWYANQKQVSNPDLIFPGEKLVIPGKHSPSKYLTASPASMPNLSGHGTTAVTVSSSSGGASSAYSAFPGAACIVAAESGGSATIVNPASGAAGLFQDLPSTWGNYDGYPSAADAPVSVQIAFNQHLAATAGLSQWAADGCPGT